MRRTNSRASRVQLVMVVVLLFYAFFIFAVYSGKDLHSSGSNSAEPEVTLPLGVRVTLNAQIQKIKNDKGATIYKKVTGVTINPFSDITVLIKTMDRPACVRQLISDIHSHHPGLSILVADDGEFAAWTEEDSKFSPYVKYFRMPYDSGLSAGRNLMLSQVQTPYIMLLEDYFLWDPAMFHRFVSVMEMHPYLDIIGGKAGGRFSGLMRVVNGTLFLVPGHHGYLEGTYSLAGSLGEPCEMVDFVPNFFLASTDTIMSIQWNNKLKIGEHEEFFIRFNKGKYKVAFCPDIVLVNQQSNCTEAHASLEASQQKRSNNIKKGLNMHKIKKLAYCLGPEFVSKDWNKVPQFPDLECHELPLPEDCPIGWAGEKCERCMPGHYGPKCKPCNCGQGTCESDINSKTAICKCDLGWVGENCETQAIFSADYVDDPSFSSLSQTDSHKWTKFQDGCYSLSSNGIWVINDGQLVCGAGIKLDLNLHEPAVIKVSGLSMSVGVKQVENPASYSLYVDLVFNDDTMQYGLFVPFSCGTHVLDKKQLLIPPSKPVKSLMLYVLLRNAYGSVYFQNITVQTQLN